MSHVFLSYAHADKAVVEELVATIQEQTGRLVWWDTLLEPGKPWNPKVKDAIQECDQFLVLVSKAALASKYVNAELGDARDLSKTIVCVLLEEIPQVDLPLPLRVDQAVGLGSWVPGESSHELDKLLLMLNPKAGRIARGATAAVYRSSVRMAPLIFLVFALMVSGCADLIGLDSSAGFALLSVRSLAGFGALKDDVVFVTIDDQTTVKLGEARLMRDKHAQALKKLGGANVVAYDIVFKPDSTQSATTPAFAASIQEARAAGASIIVASNARLGSDIEPAILEALSSDVQPTAARVRGAGLVTNPCVGERWALVATTVPLIAKRVGSDALIQSFALGAVLSHWHKSVSANWSENELALGTSEIKNEHISFTAYEPRLAAKQVEHCGMLAQGDQPVRYLLDAFHYGLKRGDKGVVPFEDLLDRAFDVGRVRKKLVVLGTQNQGSDEKTVWDGGIKPSWGVNVHLAAINTLLSGAFIRRLGPAEQFLWIAIVTVLAAQIRTTDRLVRQAARRSWLGGLIAFDLLLVGIAALSGILPDWPYHLLAMVLSYRLAVRMSRTSLKMGAIFRRFFRPRAKVSVA